ncbi:MAG: ABC transporter substrate-binding protein [Chitinivibrionales bacterium]|nr:ABC transporter substrate-binding protein [Chitinivibrionales bacterium]
MRIPLSSVLCWLIVFSFSVSGSEDPAVVLRRARAAYRAGNYDSTTAIIRAFIKKHGKEPSSEHLVPLLVESLLRTGDNATARRMINIFKRKFPESKYLPRIYYAEGMALAGSEEYTDAAVAFSRAVKSGVSEELERHALDNVELLCGKVFTLRELELLAARRGMAPGVVEVAEYFIILKSQAAGMTAKAQQRAGQFRERFPRSRYISRVKDISGKLKKQKRGKVQIGLLAPLSGYDAEIGRSIVRGVQIGLGRYEQQSGIETNLVISDTKGNMIETANKTVELVNDHRISLIIGPVLSQNAVVAASILMNRDVVMLSPTATDDGIAELGSNIFQMNVTLGALGVRLARYAVKNLNIKEFAIISPLSEYGRLMSAKFKREVQRLGAEVVGEEYFDEGAHDFREQFVNLRTVMTRRRRQAIALEKGLETMDSWSARRDDSLYLSDSTIEIGGLFIPAESEDVVKVAAQAYFHKLRTQMLGSNGWHSNKTILDGKRYVNDAIISTNFEINANNNRWKGFREVYQQKYAAEPDRVAAMGYDAAELLMIALKKTGGDPDANEVARKLGSIKSHVGVSGTVTFDPLTGANTEAAIMKISDKKFVRIQ